MVDGQPFVLVFAGYQNYLGSFFNCVLAMLYPLQGFRAISPACCSGTPEPERKRAASGSPSAAVEYFLWLRNSRLA